MDDNKRKALDAALGQIDRQFGKGSVMRLGDSQILQDIQCYSTGSLGLDIALGVGGRHVGGSSRFTGRSHPARPP